MDDMRVLKGSRTDTTKTRHRDSNDTDCEHGDISYDLLNIVCRQRLSEDRDREQLVQEKELSHAHRRDRNDCYSSMFLHSTY